MPTAMYVLEQYAAEVRKKDTIWMVFNTLYNDVHAFKQELTEENGDDYLRDSETDLVARDEFSAFMKENFTNIDLVEVGDLVSTCYMQWPYLGSIAIDTDVGSEVYLALCDKYGDPYKDPIANNACLWVVEIDDANYFWAKRQESWENL